MKLHGLCLLRFVDKYKGAYVLKKMLEETRKLRSKVRFLRWL